MGVWSYKPMCNDSILNIIGGYLSTSDIENALLAIIKGQPHNEWLESDIKMGRLGILTNDIVGIIADTYGTPKYTRSDKAVQAIQEINTLKLSEDNGCLYESLWTWASICTIPVERRNVIFKAAIESAQKRLNSDSNWTNMDELLSVKKEVLAYAVQKYKTQLKDATVIDPDKLKKLWNIYHNEEDNANKNVLVVTCINKIKQGNKIVSYTIQDAKGNTKTVPKEALVKTVKDGIVKVTNLTLNGNSLY
jgi:hypothetical protein